MCFFHIDFCLDKDHFSDTLQGEEDVLKFMNHFPALTAKPRTIVGSLSTQLNMSSGTSRPLVRSEVVKAWVLGYVDFLLGAE